MKKINYDVLNDIMYFSKKILKLIYIVMISIILFIGIKLIKELGILSFIFRLLRILSPFFIGYIISWILNPIVRRLEKRGLNRIISSIIVFIIFILFVGITIYLLIPILYKQIIDFSNDIPKIIDLLDKKISFINIHKYIDNKSIILPEIFINIIKGLLSYIGIFGLSFIVSLYMLFYYDKINSFIKSKLNNKWNCVLKNINIEVRKCINGTLLVAFIVFILDTLFFFIFKLSGALLFGIFCGLTDLIPYIGPYIGGLAAILVGFSKSKLTGICISVVVIVVQLIENMILQPIVMSRATKLNPIAIMISLTIGGSLFGIIGMIIATPILAIIKVVYVSSIKCDK